MFPRLCALAEVGWTNQNLRDYADFDSRLTTSHFERLYDMGIKFRLPYPEVTMSGDMVNAVSAAPSLVTRYTTDGSDPTMGSPVFTGPFLTDKADKLRFATFYGTLSSISVGVPGSVKYLTPEVKVSSSMPANEETPLSYAEDYLEKTCFVTATAPQEGDWIRFDFTEPVRCSSIEVNACKPGSLSNPFSDSHVEISYDGSVFVNVGKVDCNDRKVVEGIAKPVKAVRVVADGPCEFKIVSVQDLKIIE